MPPRLRYPELAPEGIAQLRGLEHYLNATTALPAVLLELVRLRVSLLNDCSFCIGHHTAELRKHHEPDSRIQALPQWEASDAFTPKERAALAWADSVTDIRTRHAGDADYAAVSTFFHDKDLVDLTLAVASINAWNRLSIAFRAEWDPSRKRERALPPTDPQQPLASDAPQVSQPSVEPDRASVAPGQENHPTQDAVDDDGGKVAQS